jgi:hypothetical protein
LGFVLLGPVWGDGRGPLHVGALDGVAFRNALLDAADAWEAASDFEFDEDFAGRGACDRNTFGRGDLEDGAEFDRRDCDGFLLGTDVLAVTQYETRGTRFTGVGLIFNDDLDWAVYDGPWSNDDPDFRRVALHELGHWLGLDHEDGPLAIMSTFVGDLDVLAADDVAGARFLYGPGDEPPPTGPGRPPLDPAAACRRDELRAAAALCEAHLACEAARARAPERDPLGLARDACVDRVGGRFARRYGEAIARAAAAGASCPGTLDAAAAAALVVEPAEAIGAGLLVGTDPADPTDARLRRKLLVAAGGACDASLRAEARFVREASETQLEKRRGLARARFVERASDAIDRAFRDGVSYAGTPPVEAADAIDALVDEVAAAAAGSAP